jgi:hypothetical protein
MTPNTNRIVNAYIVAQARDGVRRLVQVDAHGTQRPERGIEHPVANLLQGVE